RDAPGEARAGNAEILQALLDERDHLVLAALRLDEAGLILIELEQPVRILRKAEEIGLLLGPLHLAAAVGALAVLELRLRPEGLAWRTVPALVLALVDVAAVIQRAEDLLHGLHVVVVCGADETVVADVEQLP